MPPARGSKPRSGASYLLPGCHICSAAYEGSLHVLSEVWQCADLALGHVHEARRVLLCAWTCGRRSISRRRCWIALACRNLAASPRWCRRTVLSCTAVCLGIVLVVASACMKISCVAVAARICRTYFTRWSSCIPIWGRRQSGQVRKRPHLPHNGAAGDGIEVDLR